MQAMHWFTQMSDLQKKIAIAALAIVALMILFPPKAVSFTNPLVGITQSQHYGYVFLFSDPTAQARGAGDIFGLGQLVHSHVEWGKLIFQIVVVGGLAFFAIKSQGPQSTRFPSSRTS